MTLKEFRILKHRIDKQIEKAENEALEEGIDITSEKFQSFLDEIKVKLLAGRGMSLNEYKKMESEIDIENERVDISSGELMKLAERIEKDSKVKKEKSKEEKEKFDRNIEKLQEEHFVEINKLAQESDRKIKKVEEKQLKEEDIKQLIPKVKYYDKEIQQLSKKVDSIKIPEQRDWTDKIDALKWQIKTDKKEVEKMVKKETEKKVKEFSKSLTPKENKSLDKKAVDKLIKDYIHKNLQIHVPYGGGGMSFKFADNETPTGDVNGTNKTFTLDNTPDPVTCLRFKVEGAELILDSTNSNGCSLSGKTVTTIMAPPTGALVRAYYRY